jgi:phosphatidylglycerophosphate synthase
VIRTVVFDTDAPFLDRGAPSQVDPSARLAGLSLVRRALLTAWRAGAQDALIVTRDQAAADRWEQSERGLPIPVRAVAEERLRTLLEPDDLLLVQAAQVHAPPACLERLLRGAEGTGRPVRFEGDTVVPAVLRGAEFPPGSLAPLLRSAERLPSTESQPRRLDTPETLRQVDRDMYRGLTSISDGYIDRVFNRHISGWFTRRIINYPITPNHVTYFHFSLGLLGAGLFWQGAYWQCVLGAILFQLSVALDCSDGEVARLKFQFSKFGSWLDVVTDNVVTLAVFVAVARSVYVRYGLQLGLTLGAMMVTGVLMCIAVVFTMAKLLEKRQPGEASSLSVTNRLSSNDQGKLQKQETAVDKVINEATSRDFSVLVVACALAGRLDWFAWLAAIGSHVFWIVFGAIQWSMLRVRNAKSD